MIDLSFDNGTVEQYTLVLSSRDYTKLGQLTNIRGLKYTHNFNAADELSFEICKELDGHQEVLWDDVFDLRLIWVRELNEYFEIRVELTDKVYMTKTITCTSLCECELSQAGLYNIEINTADDIARPDYDAKFPTQFYRILPKPNDPDYKLIKNSSLLHRILDKVPAYSIGHVDKSLMKLQRMFSISDSTVYDFLTGECSEQFNCIFKFDSATRTVSAYDLYTVCNECGHRGDFNDCCPKCGSTDLQYYGEDTTIFVSTENLTDQVQFETDVDSIKNAFRLEAGDDNMTAAVINSNPNGSRYIYEFSPEARKDMPEELVSKMDEYDIKYFEYNNTYKIISDSVTTMPKASKTYLGQIVQYIGADLDNYKNGYFYRCIYDDDKKIYLWSYVIDNGFNKVAKKYSLNTCQLCGERGDFTICPKCYSSLLTQKTWPTIGKITGYKELIPYYYECIDLYSYLKSSMMPEVLIPKTTVEEEAKKLNLNIPLSEIGISRVASSTAVTTANIAVLNWAKTMVNTGYVKVTVDTDNSSYPNKFEYIGKTGEWDYGYWSGRFKLTNFEDPTDYTYTDYFINIAVNTNYAEFIEQKIVKQLSKADEYAYDVLKLIKNPQPYYGFKDVIRLYSASRLQSFHDAIEAVIGILIDAGQGNSGETICNTCGHRGYFDNVCPECGSTDLKVSGSPKSELYDAFYVPYYQALVDCEEELNLRNQEIAAVWGSYDTSGVIQSEGMIQFIAQQVTDIHKFLDFKEFVGENLYKIYTTYIREDTYSNSNYISDGLDNSQLFDNARQFLDRAKEELHKSAVYQHSIKSNLNNLLAIKEFKPLLDKFELGNWIRVQADNMVYRLRLISYSIDFDNLKNINTEFSDVTVTATGLNDIQSIIKQASSIASSYGYVEKQAESGSEAKAIYINDWLQNGLNSALVRINNNDDEDIRIDEAGITARTYDDVAETYDDEQLRITHNIIAFTDDGWKSVKAALGKFEMQHHAVNEAGLNLNAEAINKYTEYGLVANAVLAGWIVGSYMESSTIIGSHFQFPGNDNYIDMSSDSNTPGKEYFIKYGNEFLLDKKGNAKISGEIYANSGRIGNWKILSTNSTYYIGAGALHYEPPGKILGYHSNTAVLSPEGCYMIPGKNQKRFGWTSKSEQDNETFIFGAGQNFGVNVDGKLYASDANIDGNIIAKSGQIGIGTNGENNYWYIGYSSIYNGCTSIDDSIHKGTYVGTDGIRNQTINGSKFVKIYNGILQANNVDLSGKITATSGKIGPWTITSSGFENGSNAWVQPNEICCGQYGSTFIGMRGRSGGNHGGYLEVGVNAWDDCIHISYKSIERNNGEYWVEWQSDSDERVKKDIKPLSFTEALGILNMFEPLSFRYKKGDQTKNYGSTAQIIEAGCKKYGYENCFTDVLDDGDTKVIKYTRFITPLIKVVQEQQKEINELKQLIKGVKGNG